MVKLMLCAVIIAAGVGAGYLKAKPYENRLLHLQDLTLALKALEGEMKYSRDPLGILLARIGEKLDNRAGVFFLEVRKNLEKEFSFDFQKAWNQAVAKVYGETSLTAEDRDIVCQLAGELGKTDLTGQGSFFQRAFEKLAEKEKEAGEIRITKGRMYRGLYTAVAVLIVIILI